MYVLLKSKIVKTCKKHDCAWCGEEIPIGSKVPYRSYIFDYPGITTDWMHTECEEAMKNSGEYELEDGWDFGTNERGEPLLNFKPPVSGKYL